MLLVAVKIGIANAFPFPSIPLFAFLFVVDWATVAAAAAQAEDHVDGISPDCLPRRGWPPVA